MARSEDRVTTPILRPLWATIAQGRQQAQFLGDAFDLDYGDMPPSLDAFKMELRNDPVIGKAEGEVRIFVKKRHHGFFFCRIIVSFSCRVIALIAASCFNAELWLERGS